MTKNKSKSKIPIVLAIIFSVILIIVVVRILSPEDDWICQEGAWVKHGNPSSSMPDSPCPIPE